MNKKSIQMVIMVAALLTMGGCCRQATEFQMSKWEKKYKFESPRQFWGLHIFTKKDKPIKIKYEKRGHKNR